MFWWLLAAIVGFYVLRHLWKAYAHPAHVLGRQAANMNWIAIGRRKDETGYYDVCVSRDGIEALISFKHGNVRVIKPSHPTPFKDFIEVERWLAKSESSHDDKEVQYYQAIEMYITDMGYYEPLLELQGTDQEYCVATMKLYKAGYMAEQSEKVIGALTMDSVKKYEANRDLAMLFLESLEKKFLGKEG
jgi:hypothetical protein